MKKVYGKPSMAINSFVSDDITSIHTLSSLAQGRGATAEKYGLTVLDWGQFKK